jgi:hypothetical protein
MRRKGRAEQSGLNDAELKLYIQVFKETMLALNQIEEQVKASSTRLNEVLEEVRLRARRYRSSSIGCHRHEICQDEADEAKSVVCAIEA